MAEAEVSHTGVLEMSWKSTCYMHNFACSNQQAAMASSTIPVELHIKGNGRCVVSLGCSCTQAAVHAAIQAANKQVSEIVEQHSLCADI